MTRYRVRLVLEFEDRPSPADGGDGSARYVELDPVGDPALAGAGALSAVLEEEAAFRLLGHLSSELERGLELEGAPASVDQVFDAVAAAGARFAVEPGHAFECWAERPGGSCREGCSCRCHAVDAAGGVVDPDARCESPLEAYCERAGVFVVELAESGNRIAVCSPCGERLWAEGSASEPLEGTGPAVFAEAVSS